MRSRRSVAERRRRAATPATSALARASVPTWLSNGPGLDASTVNTASACSASGDSALSVTATSRRPALGGRPRRRRPPSARSGAGRSRPRRRPGRAARGVRSTRTSDPATSSTPGRTSGRGRRRRRGRCRRWPRRTARPPGASGPPAGRRRCGTSSGSTASRVAWTFSSDGSEGAAHGVVDRPLPDALGRRPQALTQLGLDGGLQLDEAVVADAAREADHRRPAAPGPVGERGDRAERDRLGVVDARPRPPGARPEGARDVTSMIRSRTDMEQTLQCIGTPGCGHPRRRQQMTVTSVNPARPAEVVGTYPAGDRRRRRPGRRRGRRPPSGSGPGCPSRRGPRSSPRPARCSPSARPSWPTSSRREAGKVLVEAGGDVQEAIDMAGFVAGQGRAAWGETVPSELGNKLAGPPASRSASSG